MESSNTRDFTSLGDKISRSKRLVLALLGSIGIRLNTRRLLLDILSPSEVKSLFSTGLHYGVSMICGLKPGHYSSKHTKSIMKVNMKCEQPVEKSLGTITSI